MSIKNLSIVCLKLFDYEDFVLEFPGPAPTLLLSRLTYTLTRETIVVVNKTEIEFSTVISVLRSSESKKLFKKVYLATLPPPPRSFWIDLT